jgi:dGTPase
LAFLVEAADDICFRIVDFEDAFHLKNVSFKEVEQNFSAIAQEEIDTHDYGKIEDEEEKVQYLRGKVITALIKDVADLFIEKEKEILLGEFDEELINHVKSFSDLEEIEKISLKKAYKSKEVLEIEVPGFKVIGELLDVFTSAVNDLAENNSNPRPKSKKITSFMAGILGPQKTLEMEDKYKRTLYVTDFISGMTDSYAISVYKNITGISLQRI